MAPTIGHGQLVADGSTNIFDGIITNSATDITVGTNGSFTLLALTNGAVVTGNSGTIIGAFPGARSNVVVLNGPGSAWTNTLDFAVGQSGSFNQLLIFSGAVVSNRSGILGVNASSTNNLALVSDPGSLWVNSTSLLVGQAGRAHQVIVSNGATLVTGTTLMGPNGNSPGNIVTVTGTNSLWKSAGITVGQNGIAAFNQVILASSGTVSNSGDCTLGNSTFSNTFLVTDPGTRFTNSGHVQFGVSSSGRGNQLIVSNGGFAASDYTHVGTSFGYLNLLTLTGAGSTLTNRHDFYLGHLAPSNQLYVSDGAMLADDFGYIGSSNIENRALIFGTNALWTNRSDLYIGHGGSAVHNQLTISNGAWVFDNNGSIGANTAGASNVVVVTGPGSLWTNRSSLAISQAGQLFVTNGGSVGSPSASVLINQGTGTNRIMVSGAGSVWRTLGNLNLGNGSLSAVGNEVTISNGAWCLPAISR